MLPSGNAARHTKSFSGTLRACGWLLKTYSTGQIVGEAKRKDLVGLPMMP